ncbi:uncharacterized protein LOC129240328 [Anastrepha obliqua]|uniref:uncharacterized protein LOC129240328 n=1 Tax=Anastrepha obliqua TaxID=95512 RepID=UPI00240A1A61|nr:uncharacterized protein LOC129240328 [Anastrepha obliqua]XP_054732058.1 uncharacterized protein LOC129240328 [Anastrepha obliqua]XP_054732066.1 uncharacterized protein LOC129240328 [Anastrepha obliqua]XP_054732076.1 uncharacterized protein LOC129240328 [Anastrepha obliqua]
MAMNNLSIDGEFRYIIQWFNEWSELQRDDFVPVLVEYLLQGEAGEVYMNGMVNSVALTGIQDKPMSLFQCRIKLFREWNKKWPLELKHKLQEKIVEIDSKVGEKITNEIKSHGGEPLIIETNGCNGVAVDTEVPIEAEVDNGENATSDVTADELAETAEEAINLDSQIVAALNNETPVDDNITTENATTNATADTTDSAGSAAVTATILLNSIIDTQLHLEPADQVQMQTQSVLEENNATTDCSATTTATVA